MNADDYKKLKDIFQAVVELPPDERAAYLDEKCDGNVELRSEAERLLASLDDEFLERPAVEPISSPVISGVSLSGQRVGHYNVIRKIGSGGMGDVYLATDGKLGRRVAVKILPEEFTAEQDRLDRFQLEARSASALSHPNILTIHEIGEWAGTHYIATEYVEGETLRHRISRERLSVPETLEVGVQLVSAIAAAHEAGICHRDIKPENIMIRRDGIIKVVDFGLVKLTPSLLRGNPARPTSAGDPTVKIVRTEPGVIMGTVQYMSPEQTRSLPTDERSDIWSLGCVLYEMLAGRAPFEGENSADLIAEIVKTYPAQPSSLNPDVPERLDEIVGKALEKNPDERYQTAKDLLIDLKRLKRRFDVDVELERSQPRITTSEETVISGPNIISTKKGPKDLTEVNSAQYLYWGMKAHRWTAIGIALLLIGLVGGTALLVRYYWSLPDEARIAYSNRITLAAQALDSSNLTSAKQFLDEAVPKVGEEDLRGFEWGYLARLHSEMSANQPVVFRLSSVDSVTFSPDGHSLAAGGTANEVKVWDIQTERETLQLRGHSGWITSVAFSPDGLKIASGSFDKSAKIWDARNGKELLTITGNPGNAAVGFLSFSKDGQTLIGAEGADIKFWDALNGSELPQRRFTQNVEPPFAISGDGKMLAARTREDDRTAVVMEINTGRELFRLRGHTGFLHDIAFAPDSKTILTGSSDRSAKLWEANNGKVLHTFRGHNDDVRDVSFAPDGKFAASGSNDDTVRLWDIRGGYGVATFKGHRGDVQALSFSPGGRKLASGGGNGDDSVRIWSVPLAEPRGILRGHLAEVTGVAFSPDGRFLASASADKRAVIWDVETERELFTLEGHADQVNSVSFSPDGNTLATGAQDGKIRQWNTSTGKQIGTLNTQKKGAAVLFSPDGRMLAATHFLNDTEVEIWDALSGVKRCSFAVGEGGAWGIEFSRNGTQITASAGGRSVSLWDPTNCSKIWSFEGEPEAKYGSLIMFDGTILAIEILNEGRSLRIVDGTTRQEISSIRGHDSELNSARLSPDGKRLVTSAADSTVKVWDLKTGQELLSISTGSEGAIDARFSQDGKLLAVAGADGTVRLFRSDPL